MKRRLLLAAAMTGAMFSLPLSAAQVCDEYLAKAHGNSVNGGNRYYYSAGDFRHVKAGTLAGGGAAAKSAAKRNQNPVRAVTAFNNELKKLGVELIVMPVPVKMSVYPPAKTDAAEIRRIHADFYAELAQKGVKVIDLAPLFTENCDKGVYCKTDSHWSPAGLRLAAETAAAEVAKSKWYSAYSKSSYVSVPRKCTFQGDLVRGLPEIKETVTVNCVEKTASENAPVLVIGDSHTLVFSSGGDMLAENGGFAENLAEKLSLPVEVIGVRGSGATPVRINLFRKASRNPEWLKNKKVVIWVFAAREFTQSTGGWAVIPVLKNKR